MKKQFVPYELALKLKELGFDEPCIMYYDNIYDNALRIGTNDDYWGDYTGFQKWNSMPNSPWKPFKPLISAPLWQQAFNWFREKGFVFTILPDIDSKTLRGEEVYCIEILQWDEEKQWYQCKLDTDYIYKSNKEAEVTLLEKLIELVEKL